MTTISKFYLHDAVTPNAGTMPSGNNNYFVAPTGTATGGLTVRDATAAIGVGPQITVLGTCDGTTNSQNLQMRRFVSRPLAVQTIPFATNWTFSGAGDESNLNANLNMAALVYVWRPSTGAQVGSGGPQISWSSPASELSTTETASTGTSSGVVDQAIQDGDILVFDIQGIGAPSMSTAYTADFYYDGTTEASSTNCASFISPPSALTLQDPPLTAPNDRHQSIPFYPPARGPHR